MPLGSHNTPQPMPAGNSLLPAASEASVPGTPHAVLREKALAKRQLELSKARNRAMELQARNVADEIQQEIEFETRFGHILEE